jgi:hypothetical protein
MMFLINLKTFKLFVLSGNCTKSQKTQGKLAFPGVWLLHKVLVYVILIRNRDNISR